MATDSEDDSEAADVKWSRALNQFGLQLSRCHGRGIRVARRFEPGNVLLKARPVAAVVAPGVSRCHHCVCMSAQLKRCGHCGHARYCSAGCQKAAWASHRNECRVLQRTMPHVPGTSMLLLARLLDLAHADASANTVEAAAWPSSIGATLCLSSHLDKLSPTRAQEFAAQAAMLRGLLAEAQPERPAPPPELATRLLATLACNGHTLSDDELQPLGLGLYPLAALTNHDCSPSAVHCFEGTTLVLRALRPLDPGEAVTIGYVDLAQPLVVRRRELANQYAFHCACERCVSEQSRAPHEARLLEHASAAFAAARSEVLAAIDAQQWAEALTAARSSAHLAPRLVPPGTAALGLEWLRLAKLLAHAGQIDEAMDAWQRARRVLAVTHGESAPLVRTLDADLADAMMARGMHEEATPEDLD